MPTTLPDKPPRQTRKSKYVIQEPQIEATNDKPIENQWIDYSSTFDSTADAMKHIKTNAASGTYRIVAVKAEFTVTTKQVAKVTITSK